jgi:beta-glucosidase
MSRENKRETEGGREGGIQGAELTRSNLEWHNGYAPRFGITAVDRANGFKRHPKDSAFLLGKIFAHVVEKGA